MPTGRKTLRTPETAKAILDAITLGGSDKDAALYAGISEDTLSRWQAADASFADNLRKARIQGKLQRIGRIKKHGENDWRADAWYLERRWPEEYAQQLIVKVTHEQAAVLKKHGLTASEAFNDLIENIAKADAEIGGNS